MRAPDEDARASAGEGRPAPPARTYPWEGKAARRRPGVRVTLEQRLELRRRVSAARKAIAFAPDQIGPRGRPAYHGMAGDWRPHGTVGSYRDLLCRCELCTAAARATKRFERANNPELRQRENAQRRARRRSLIAA